jgi:hypothetical protein
MDRLAEYRRQLCNMLTENSVRNKSKFISLFPGMFLGTPLRDVNKPWPATSVLSRSDMEYYHDKGWLKCSVDDIMKKAHDIWQHLDEEARKDDGPRHSNQRSDTWDSFRHAKHHAYMSKRQAKMVTARHMEANPRTTDMGIVRATKTLTGVYGWLKMNANHFAVPPAAFINVTKEEEKVEFVELFGSPLNTWTKQYCSPFAFEQYLFGSQGRCHEFLDKLMDNPPTSAMVLLANPPFQVDVMEAFVTKLLNTMEALPDNCPVSIIVFMPLWHNEKQSQLGTREYGTAFKPYTDLRDTDDTKEWVLERDNFPYYDYMGDRLVLVGHTTMQLVSKPCMREKSIDIANNVVEAWRQLNQKV